MVILITDKLQGSVATLLRYGGLFSYHLTKYLSLGSENKFKISECLAKLQAKKADCHCMPCSPCNNLFSL